MSEYAVYALRYGRIEERRAAENFIGGDPHDGPMPLDFYVWAVVGEERTIIIDTGFDERMAAKRNRTIVRPVAKGLAELEIDPERVEDVVITHMHYDHAGNHNLFPRARYHLQEKEMHYCTGRCMHHDALRHPYEADDVAAMVKRLYEGKVVFHDGSKELAPGLSLHWVGGHTGGLQVVRVQTRRGWVVLASDASHYYANMQQHRPFPIVYNVGDMLDGHDTLTALASSPAHIIPGHDPLVLERYPSAGPLGTVRLDAPPLMD